METKNLKHRKRQKKNKSGSDKGNADVLVVPPDILKKLGISIGSNNTQHQIPNILNMPQNTGTCNNESVAGLPAKAKVNKKSSESSILETAILMKESVFLSPTFVPTVANMISGEVEISNVQNNNDAKRLSESFALENIRDRSVHYESTSNNKEYEDRFKNNGNLELNVVTNGVQNIKSNVFKNISTGSEIHKQLGKIEVVLEKPKIINDDAFKVLSKLTDHNNKSVENRNYSDFILSERINESRSSEIADGTSNSKYNGDFIETSDTVRIIDFSTNSDTEIIKKISLEKNTNQGEEGSANDNLKSLKKNESSIDKAVIASDLNENTSIMEQDIDNNFSFLKKTENHIKQSENENKTTSLKSSQNPNKCTDVNNDIFSLEGKAIQIEKNDVQDNLISVSENSTCFEEAKNNILSLEGIKRSNRILKKQVEVENVIISLECNDTYLTEVEDNTISLKDIRNENEFAVNDSNIISVEDNKYLITGHKIVSTEDNIIQEKETCSEKKPVSFEDASMQIKHGEKDNNANSLNCTIVHVNQAEAKNNHTSLDEQINLAQNICKDYLKDVMVKDCKLNTCPRLRMTVQSNLRVDDIVTSASNVSENISHRQKTVEPENIVKIQEYESKPIGNNKIVLYDCHVTQNLNNGGLKDTTKKAFDLKSTETIPDVVGPVHKILQKINIISEEIIPPLDLKDQRKSHSPIIQSLTPVPLNSIITPKRNNDYTCEIKVVDRRSSTVLPKQTEVLASKTLSCTISSSPAQFDSKCDIDTTKISTEENVLTNTNPDTTPDKGDLKNNNDILNASFVIETSTVKHSEHLSTHKVNEVSGVQNDCTPDIPKSQINGIHCSQVATENVDIIQAQNSIADEQNLKINSDNGALDRKSSPEYNLSVNNFRAGQASFADKKDSKDLLDKKKKKKKKINESKIINVRCIEDKEFCNNQINDIVKSSKENNDTNANLDKVKEIAEYIKKYAHIYKDNKQIINKVENKKGTINSKTNMIKSKLCIQGVEKPGGNKGSKEVSDNIKVLKTYTRQKKHNEPCASEHLTDKSKPVPCNVGDISENELNTINTSMSCKSQDFCLCYDFGRLDTSVYDNSYEHIHFWLHDDTADLESILSIYNDEEVIVNDRTKLDDVKICEVIETNTKTSNICWNYFHMAIGTSNQMCSIDSAVDESNHSNSNDSRLEKIDSLNENPGKISKTVNIDDRTDDIKQTDSNINSSLIKDSNSSYEVITIVEMVDNENVASETAETDSIMTTIPKGNVFCKAGTSHSIPKEILKSNSSQLLKAIKKVAVDSTDKEQEYISDPNNKTNKQGTSKSDTVEMMKKEASLFLPESSNRGRRKRSLSVDDTSEEPCPKKTFKCGVCNKLLIEAEWNKHVANKHNYIAWKAGQTFNFDDPDLLQKLRDKFETVGSLKCPNCYMQTRKFNKFIGHLKSCIKQKECSSRRTSSSKDSSRRASSSKDLVTCGICQKKVQYLSWNEHIGKEHNYLAWIEGQDALDIEDEAAVVKHLQTIIKCNGGLVCYKCGLNRKRVKLYLTHIETCNGSEIRMADSTVSGDMDSTLQEDTDKKILRCGVCKQEIPVLQWTEHVGKEHNYLAWEDGLTPLNLDDEEMVRNHLQEFIRNSGGLRCYKCGLNRKRVKLYLSHIKTCDGEGVNLDESVLEDVSMDQGTSEEKKFECGVCHAKVLLLDWNEHIGREHNYLAWKLGDTPLDISDEDAVKEHLLDIIRKYEGLICYKCGLNRRRVKLYLSHIKTCDGSENQGDQSTKSNLNSTLNSTQIEISIDGTERIVKCAVCDQDVSLAMWIKHIGREHKYLAWQQGQDPLNLEDDEMVKAHLLHISKDNSGLICNLCHVTKKYPKSFLQHVKDCSGVVNLEDSKIKNEPEVSSFDISDVKTDTVICGVCNKVVVTAEWLKHMENDHDYMGWLQGRPPLDLKDPAAVQRHLIEVSRCTGGLKCKNCGLVRKYAKSYLHHIDHCTNGGNKIDSAIMMGKDSVTCAVCSETVDPRDWRDHAMKKHYNVAWLVGATPIEINNPYGVEPYIKEYQQRHNNKLVCKTCGISRVSAVGFYAHIITCGKTEQETEIYKSMCEICNSKYLRIYKSQHMTMHREKEYAIERKLLIAKEKELKKEEDEPVEIIGGRRKAAEKAKTVIEKYTSNVGDGSNCSKCGFSSDVESEMSSHVCVENQYEGSESDESVYIDYSSEEDDDTDIDSNISDEEREARDREQTKSKKHGDSNSACRVQRLPYQIKNLNSYMRKSAEEFAALHLTDKDLFKQYRTLDYKLISEADLPKYMPPVAESCKVRYSEQDDWITYKRFEAKIEKDLITIFTGACIQSMCWVPPYVEEHDAAPAQEYLSVLSALASDTPRHFWYDKPAQKPALIQIWDCGDFISGVPELVMGLALDCGTVWAVDWCPSGARDVFDALEECNETRRLGLLAVASANGSAYVFAVPHPSTTKEKGQFCKLNAVVELRLAMDANRKEYQATAIKWSKQKGHAHIVVGYADGTTAYFDLKNESPLLRCTENNIDIIYPYHDERTQNMCIEDLDVFPTAGGRQGCGAVVAGSVGGSGSRQLHAHAAATRVLFPPHWPAALLAGDDNLVSQAVNELEWFGAGRRVGGMRCAGGCAWCGRLAASSAPLVRLMRTHPAYSDLHRQIIAILQMVPFGNKRKRKNDELSMIMEPLTYDDTVLKYGIELKQVTAKDKNTQQKLSGITREAYPERFPLADVIAMAFCPTYTNHHKLAIATHAGLIFIMNV